MFGIGFILSWTLESRSNGMYVMYLYSSIYKYILYHHVSIYIYDYDIYNMLISRVSHSFQAASFPGRLFLGVVIGCFSTLFKAPQLGQEIQGFRCPNGIHFP